jgi:YjbE family integral membrane protein
MTLSSLAAPVTAFFQVVMIDLVLAGDNAVAVGMAAAGLPAKDRRKAIVLGLAAAVVMLISFALIARTLLNVIGLTFAGGLLLLWVCWKMFRDLRQGHAQHEGEEAVENAVLGAHHDIDAPARKTLMAALIQILITDLSMSLDNVLAVAGAARTSPPYVLIAGLLLSVTLMGFAASAIARLLMRYRWLAWIGLVIVLYVSGSMIWQGHREVVVDLGRTHAYNRLMPDPLDIHPKQKTR